MHLPGLGDSVVGRRRAGLTLIELLIVMAVIGLLAAIGMVNYQKARTRAKVSVSKSQLRTLSGAIEAYHVDQGSYPVPIPSFPDDPFGVVASHAVKSLTTPVAYVSPAAFEDPFGALRLQFAHGAGVSLSDDDPFRPPTPGFNTNQSLLFFQYGHFAWLIGNKGMWVDGYSAVSIGPDKADSFIVYYPFPDDLPPAAVFFGVLEAQDTVYDPTNGTVSQGDLAIFGGELPTGGLVGGGNL